MRREALLLVEMVDAARQAMTLVAGRDGDELCEDRLRRDALLWSFMVLGEASSQLPAEFKADHPEVNWARPTQLRHRIVHGYWSVDMDVLITTAELDLPSFVEQLEAVLREIDG